MQTKELILKQNEKSFNQDIVHNLSNYNLKTDEINLLSKGLNFCPNIDSCKLQSDKSTVTNKLITTINNRLYFHNLKKQPYERHPFHRTSNWTAPRTENTNLADFIHNVTSTQTTDDTPTNSFTFNYTESTIHSLLNNNTIIIKKADKGGGLCILNKQDYITRIFNEHLNNKTTYRTIDYDPTPHIRHDTITLINYLHHKNHIDDTTKRYLTPDENPRTPIFYGLPKIHKQNFPLRPIVSAFNSPTDNLCKYITHFLQPLCEFIPSYIKDSKHFLQLIEAINTIPDNSILVTADVKSLYTNIPHDDGIESIFQHYSKWLHTLPSYAPNANVITILLHFILKHSHFRFQEQHFIQNTGTSMGGRYAPPYANIFMSKIEDIIYQEWSSHIPFWKRFIDDIFFIFTGSLNELNRLKTFMNSIHDTIKFTFTESLTSIAFLDTLIYTVDRKLMTSLYRKPTDKTLLLHFDSNHSLHTKESIIYSQALRYNMTIKENKLLQTELYNLTRTLLARRYPLHIINRNIQKSLKYSRLDLLHKTKKTTRNKKQNNFLPYGIHEKDLKLKYKIKQHWYILQNDENIRKIIPNRPTAAFKRNITLGNILVRSDTV